MSEFKDHFSQGSDQYQQYRPTYPLKLFSYLASRSPDTQLVWDCATGSGQAAIALADHFEQVIATDASQSQINNVQAHPRITYRCAAETDPDISDNSVSLITVAQALHWFNTNRFFDEVERVLKPQGALAIWSYNLLEVSSDIDTVIHDLYFNTIYDNWPPERRLVEDNYQSITLPFNEVEAPVFEMSLDWDYQQLVGYLQTWSAVKRYHKRTNTNPLDQHLTALQDAWGNPGLKQTIHWPLTLRVAIKPIN